MILQAEGNVWRFADIRPLRGLRKIGYGYGWPTKCFSGSCHALLLQTSCAATGQLLGVIYPAKGNQAEAPSLDQVR